MTDSKKRVAELDAEIGAIDRAILQQLEARARLSKVRRNELEGQPLPVDVGEGAWLEGLCAVASGDVPPESIRQIFRPIRALARSIEEPVRVAYLAPEGGLCQQAAESYFGAGASWVEAASTERVLGQVTRGRASFAVFPFESSLDGLNQQAITALAETPLVLVGQRELRLQYDLVSRSTEPARVERLYGTAAALAACDTLIERDLPMAEIIDVRSPLVAVRHAREDEANAAIVSQAVGRAGEVPVLRDDVADACDIRIRFGIAGKRPASRTGRDTTCLLFSVNDAPGALYGVLKHFAERHVNLRRMQARPVSGQGFGFDYVFYVELDGHVTDRALVTALEALKHSTRYLHLLGSFPSDQADLRVEAGAVVPEGSG